jgi:hypothetical protein
LPSWQAWISGGGFMKKKLMFSLMLLVLGATVQPLRAMKVRKIGQKRDPIYEARMDGVRAGLATGFVSGLIGARLLNSTASEAELLTDQAKALHHDRAAWDNTLQRRNNKKDSGMLQFILFNAAGSEAINQWVKRPSYRKPWRLAEKETLDRWHFWTDAAVTSTLIAGMASGALMTLCEPGAIGERNSASNFGKVIVPVFAGVALLKGVGNYVYKHFGLIR